MSEPEDQTDRGITAVRRQYHQNLCRSILGYRNGFVSNADRSSKSSAVLAEGLLERIGIPGAASVPTGQAIGTAFEGITAEYLRESFELLRFVRPGNWTVSTVGSNSGIAAFDQYEHLKLLGELVKSVTEAGISAALQMDYLIAPDVTVGKLPFSDDHLNSRDHIVDPGGPIGIHTPLRAANSPKPTLHATVSCKWTMRSDRAQNVRTEALNLIRNRKGRVPHVVAVTAEPMPTRLASLALGTGDLDCVYHFALPELASVVCDRGSADQREMFETLVDGRRSTFCVTSRIYHLT